MSGTELKNLLTSQGYNISEVAVLLGYANPQRLHSALAAADVKSGLIEDIARVTGRSVWDFYPDAMKQPNTVAVAKDSGIAVAGNSNTVDSSDKFIALLNKKDEQIDRLLLIIENLNKR